MDSARNPNRTRRALTAKLRASLGLNHIHWLHLAPLRGDDTDGLIDTLARFIDTNTIAYQGCDDPNHPNHAGLQQLQAQLTALRNAQGTPYTPQIARSAPATRRRRAATRRLRQFFVH